MKHSITILIFFLVIIGNSQTTVSGKVVDNKNQPILGANVYLDGTYDGATSDKNGKFSFKTTETGEKNLVISMLSFETKTIVMEVSK